MNATRRSFLSKVMTGAVGAAVKIPAAVASTTSVLPLGAIMSAIKKAAGISIPANYTFKDIADKTLNEVLQMNRERNEALDGAISSLPEGYDEVDKTSRDLHDLLWHNRQRIDDARVVMDYNSEADHIRRMKDETSGDSTSKIVDRITKKASKRLSARIKRLRRARVTEAHMSHALTSLQKANRYAKLAEYHLELARKSKVKEAQLGIISGEVQKGDKVIMDIVVAMLDKKSRWIGSDDVEKALNQL